MDGDTLILLAGMVFVAISFWIAASFLDSDSKSRNSGADLIGWLGVLSFLLGVGLIVGAALHVWGIIK